MPSGASSRRHPRAHGPDRFGARPGRPDRGLHRVPRRHRRRLTACSRSSCPTRRPGSSSSRSGPGSDDDLLDALDRLLPREDRLYRHRHGSPGHGADHVLPLLAPPIADRPGHRRGHGPRDVAVDLPAGPERRQRDRTVRLSFLPADPASRRQDLGAPAHRRDRAALRFPSPPVAGRRYTPAQPQADPAGRPPCRVPTHRHTSSPMTPRVAGGDTRCRCVPIPRTSR